MSSYWLRRGKLPAANEPVSFADGYPAGPGVPSLNRCSAARILLGKSSCPLLGKTSCPLLVKSRHVQCNTACLLWAKSGHSRCKKPSPLCSRKRTFYVQEQCPIRAKKRTFGPR